VAGQDRRGGGVDGGVNGALRMGMANIEPKLSIPRKCEGILIFWSKNEVQKEMFSPGVI